MPSIDGEVKEEIVYETIYESDRLIMWVWVKGRLEAMRCDRLTRIIKELNGLMKKK